MTIIQFPAPFPQAPATPKQPTPWDTVAAPTADQPHVATQARALRDQHLLRFRTKAQALAFTLGETMGEEGLEESFQLAAVQECLVGLSEEDAATVAGEFCVQLTAAIKARLGAVQSAGAVEKKKRVSRAQRLREERIGIIGGRIASLTDHMVENWYGRVHLGYPTKICTHLEWMHGRLYVRLDGVLEVAPPTNKVGRPFAPIRIEFAQQVQEMKNAINMQAVGELVAAYAKQVRNTDFDKDIAPGAWDLDIGYTGVVLSSVYMEWTLHTTTVCAINL